MMAVLFVEREQGGHGSGAAAVQLHAMLLARQEDKSSEVYIGVMHLPVVIGGTL